MATNNAINTTLPPITRVNVQRFVTPGSTTYTPTAGTKYIICTIIGGGGAGGGAQGGGVGSLKSSSGGGGGGASSVQFLMTAAQIGVSLSVTVGAAGATATGNANGGNGGTTSFGDWSAPGGNGGTGCAALTTSQLITGGAFATGVTIGTGTFIASGQGQAGGYGYTQTTNLAVSGSGGISTNPAYGIPGPSVVIVSSGVLSSGGAGGRGGGSAGGATIEANVDASSGSPGAGAVTVIEYISE